jgi:hypothetical protein
MCRHQTRGSTTRIDTSCGPSAGGSKLNLVLVKIIALTSLLAASFPAASFPAASFPAAGFPTAGVTAFTASVGVASIASSRRAKIALQATPPRTVTHTGCLLAKDGHFIQQDENTQEVVEIRGPDLGVNVGNRVQVTGRASTTRPVVPIATSVVDVTSVSPRSQGGCLTVASTLGADANPPKDPGPERRKVQ